MKRHWTISWKIKQRCMYLHNNSHSNKVKWIEFIVLNFWPISSFHKYSRTNYLPSLRRERKMNYVRKRNLEQQLKLNEEQHSIVWTGLLWKSCQAQSQNLSRPAVVICDCTSHMQTERNRNSAAHDFAVSQGFPASCPLTINKYYS